MAPLGSPLAGAAARAQRGGVPWSRSHSLPEAEPRFGPRLAPEHMSVATPRRPDGAGTEGSLGAWRGPLQGPGEQSTFPRGWRSRGALTAREGFAGQSGSQRAQGHGTGVQTGPARQRRADSSPADVVSCPETARAGYMKARAGWKGVHRRRGTPRGCCRHSDARRCLRARSFGASNRKPSSNRPQQQRAYLPD